LTRKESTVYYGVLVHRMLKKQYIIPFAVSTGGALLAALIILMAINASLLRIPQPDLKSRQKPGGTPAAMEASSAAPDYKAISERNLFRAKLEAEIPKPKSEKEIEEELLTGVIRTMVLKGIMTGDRQKDYYAVIDRGAQKGVWIYEAGEIVEKGLAVKEIRKDSVILQKGDFKALLRLFAVNAERIPSAPSDTPTTRADDGSGQKKGTSPKKGAAMEIRQEGKTLVIPKLLAERVKNDNASIMSSIALKVATDSSGRPAGYRVVAIDKGSIVGKMGLKPDDTLLAVNGRSLSSGEDLKKLYEEMHNLTRFELKVLRQGKSQSLFYEVR
jgi:type II secretion system protein C